jgi:hypothetical protein
MSVDLYFDPGGQGKGDSLHAALVRFDDIRLHKRYWKNVFAAVSLETRKATGKPKIWRFSKNPAGCDAGDKPVK